MNNKNKQVLATFLASIIRVVEKNTSYNYAITVLKKYLQSKEKDFPLIEYFDLNSLSNNPNFIKIDDKISEVSKEQVSAFIKDFSSNLFSYLFIHLLIKEIDTEFLEELEGYGVTL